MNTTSRGAATRRRILDAAAGLTYKNGVNGTSVDDVLKASGTGKSQFYHYFASKEALVKELIAFHVVNSPGLQALALEPDDFGQVGAFEAWISRLLEAYRAGHFDGGCPIGNLAAELSAQSDHLRDDLQAVFASWEDALARGFEQMKLKGLLRQDAQPVRLALFCVAVLQGGLLLAKTERSAEPLAASAAELLAYVKMLAVGASALPRKSAFPLKSPRPLKVGFCP